MVLSALFVEATLELRIADTIGTKNILYNESRTSEI